MNFTQPQITEILDEIANGKNGYQHLLQLSLRQHLCRLSHKLKYMETGELILCDTNHI